MSAMPEDHDREVAKCPRCKLGVMFRVNREGYLEREILTRFGVYPWMCSECKVRTRLKRRQGQDGGSRIEGRD